MNEELEPKLIRQLGASNLFKFVRPELKVIDEEAGRFRAIVSTEDVDRDGDIIRAAGWQLDRFESHPVLVGGHDYRSIRSQIGEWEGMEIKGGKAGKRLEGEGRYYIGEGNADADWGWAIASKGRAAFSVGFIPDWNKAVEIEGAAKGIWPNFEFNGQELLEVSHVVIPSNAQALQRSGFDNLPPYFLWAVDEIIRQRANLKQEETEAPDEEPQIINAQASLRQLIIEGLTQNPLRSRK